MIHVYRFNLKNFIRPTECAEAYPELPKAFKVCGFCSPIPPHRPEVLDIVRAMEDVERKVFKNCMSKLLKIANSGEPLEAHYDKKRCHPTHSFHYKGQEHKIWRIRSADLRILFFYDDDSVLVVIDALVKRTDKLTEGQKLNAEAMVKRYVDGKPVKFFGDTDK